MTHKTLPAAWPLRVYGALLHLYPREFRDEFGEEMLCDFADATSAAWHAGGAHAVTAFWARSCWDVAGNALLQWCRTGRPAQILAAASWSAWLWGLVALQSIPQSKPIAGQLHAVWIILAVALLLVSVGYGKYQRNNF
jgi:peptidoglycan/LPS O-acetylase OafA/YrhL